MARWRLILGILAAWLAAGSGEAAAGEVAKPNIVFFLADDLGIGEVGCYGSKVVTTPNVDRLASEGMIFTRAYSASAVCAPTRCGLMTGMHMGHATRRANMSKNGLIALRPEQVTVADLLKGAGDATGGFGKWGLGNPGTTGVPESQGFDEFYGYYDQTHAHSYYPTYLVRNSVKIPLDNQDDGTGEGHGKGKVYSQELIVQETLKFIEKNKDRPFFCYAAWTLPHGRFEIPSDAPYTDKPWPQLVKNHAAMITRLDTDIGRVLQNLKDLGLEKNTLVIFTSDNGAEGPGRQTFDGTGGLRGWKRHLYEGGIRAPFVARWPGKVAAGTRSDLLTSQVDFLATACELAGAVTPKETDGISILPTLLGREQAAKHASLYWEIYEGPAPFQQAVVMGNWKGYRTALKGPLEVYDLKADPAEKNNIAAGHGDVVKQIEAIMAKEHVRNPNWDPTEVPGAPRAKGKKKK
jgi:arylsulfatase A-like enzyme